MALVVPNPIVPTNGQPLDATPLLANLNAVYQAIQSFDASQVAAGTLVASAFNANINPNTILKETESSFVFSGLIWGIVSGLQGTMSGGTAYLANSTSILRIIVNSVASNTFAASKDTYIDVDVNGNITYQAVTNGAAAPALTTNAIRIAKVVTNATNITSIVQSGLDSLNNSIYPMGSTSTGNMDWNPWRLNAKTVLNASSISPTNSNNNFGANLQLTFTVAAPCVALVNISMGVASTSDFEYQPQIYVNGVSAATLNTAASIGNGSGRAFVRGFQTIVSLVAGANTISGGVFLSASTGAFIQASGACLTALVLGKVTA